MYIYPRLSVKEQYQLKHISADEFKNRAREIANEFIGTGSLTANILYLRKRKSPEELEVEIKENYLIIESSLLWSYKFIVRLMTWIFNAWIVLGYTLLNNITISFFGLIGYIFITLLVNTKMNKFSKDNFKLIKSLDYDINE